MSSERARRKRRYLGLRLTTWATFVSLAVASAILSLMSGGDGPSTSPEDARVDLPVLSADISETSVSGISSGAYMAGQFQMAHGRIVKGAGIIAGGPYGCAESVFTGVVPAPGAVFLNASRAVSGCMLNALRIWGIPNPGLLLDKAKRRAEQQTIDPLQATAGDRIYLFSGSQDRTVVPAVVQAAAKFYELLGVTPDRIHFEKRIDAGHAFVTTDNGKACDRSSSPFVVDCDYDQAGKMLAHIYGPLAQPPVGPPEGVFQNFDQQPFTKDLAGHGLSDEGSVFIPASCQSGTSCRVHIAFHGCSQSRDSVGDVFVRKSGFARWAAANNIIVLFPQVSRSALNPQSCWDWWGYTGAGYLTREAPQVVAVRRMLGRLSGEQLPQTAPTN